MEFPNLKNKTVAIYEPAFDGPLEERLIAEEVKVLVCPYSLIYFRGWLLKHNIKPDVILGHLDRANEMDDKESQYVKVYSAATDLVKVYPRRIIFTSTGFPNTESLVKLGSIIVGRDYRSVCEELRRITF
ncbi:MAG: hypothetical protein AAB838_03455 [Patescibacteria group bacterium]